MSRPGPLGLVGSGAAEEVPYPVVLAVRQMTSRASELAAAHGLAATAESLLAAPSLTAGGARARVVVTGALGAGSSSLVNALLDTPGLLPVDEFGRPHAAVFVRQGPRPRAAVRRTVDDGEHVTGDIEEIEVDQVADAAARVAGHGVVQVQLDLPGLAGLEVVDSGALAAGPVGDALARSYASAGDAVVVTHDVSAPPGAQERAALCTLAAYAAHVILVLTRTDAAIDHEPVVAATRRMVETTPGLGGVRVLTVSSHLAAKATRLRENGSAHAGTIADLGGVEELARVLRAEVAGRHVAARLLAQAKACARAADEIVAAAAPAQDTEAAALTAERARLVGLVEGDKGSRLALQQAVQRMRSAPKAQLDEGVRAVRARMRDQVEQGLPASLDQYEEDVRSALADVVASVWQEQGDLAAEAAALVEQRWDGHQEASRLRLSLAQADLAQAPAGTLDALGERSATALATQAAQNRMMLTRSAMMMLPSMMHPARAAIGLVVGGITAGAMLRGQGQSKEHQLRLQLRQWLDRACAEAGQGLGIALDVRAMVAQQHLDDRVLELAGQLPVRRDEVTARLGRHRPPPPDPARDEITRLVRDARELVARVADRSTWPARTAPPTTGDGGARRGGTGA